MTGGSGSDNFLSILEFFFFPSFSNDRRRWGGVIIVSDIKESLDENDECRVVLTVGESVRVEWLR
jgi:hypothetical protein